MEVAEETPAHMAFRLVSGHCTGKTHRHSCGACAILSIYPHSHCIHLVPDIMPGLGEVNKGLLALLLSESSLSILIMGPINQSILSSALREMLRCLGYSGRPRGDSTEEGDKDKLVAV